MVILDLEKRVGVSIRPGPITFRADRDLAFKIGRAALQRQTSISDVIRGSLSRDLDRKDA